METAWWPDEAELFGTALAMLTDWDDAGSASSSPSSTSSREQTARGQVDHSHGGRTTEAAHRPGKAVKINRSRERQKLETQQLREQVAALEHELARLRRRRDTRRRDNHQSTGEAMLAVCENMARRQFKSRKKAEAENVKLRELLVAHASIAQDMIRALQRSQQLTNSSMFPVPGNPISLQCDLSTDEELLRRLDKISAQWSVPYSHCKKFEGPNRELSFFDSTVIRDDVYGSVFDFQVGSVLPFPARPVHNEIWQIFVSHQCEQEDFSLAFSSRPFEKSIVGDVRVTAHQDNVMGLLEARFMNRQFKNENGELVIASTMCGRPSLRDPETGKFEPVDALIHEDAWIRVVDAFNDQKKMPESPMTLVQHVRRSRIQFFGSDPPEQAQLVSLKKFVQCVVELEVRWGEEITERRILLGPELHN